MSDTMAIRIADALETLDLDTAIEVNPNMYGICGLISDMLDNCDVPDALNILAIDRLSFIFTKYPKYSGNRRYPIPAPNTVFSAEIYKGENASWAFNNLPRWSGEYGKLRMEALDWLIDYLRANPTCLSIDEYV